MLYTLAHIAHTSTHTYIHRYKRAGLNAYTKYVHDYPHVGYIILIKNYQKPYYQKLSYSLNHNTK